MEEKTNAKIDELNEKNINLGGQAVQEESKEDIEAVKKGDKTVDMVERLMSRDEILEVARKNSLYANMVGPCLAGNVSLDGRLLEFLNSPMKEVDLEDNIIAAMNVLVYEISREQNGLVFNSNGTLNVYGRQVEDGPRTRSYSLKMLSNSSFILFLIFKAFV